MFGSLGGPEVILILVIALIVFGPRRLPDIGKSMGKMLAEFRKASNDFKRTIEDEVEAERTKESPAPLPPSLVEPPGPSTVSTIDPAAYAYGGGHSTEAGATPAPAEPESAPAGGAETAAPAAGPAEPEADPTVPVGTTPAPRVESPAEATVSRSDEK